MQTYSRTAGFWCRSDKFWLVSKCDRDPTNLCSRVASAAVAPFRHHQTLPPLLQLAQNNASVVSISHYSAGRNGHLHERVDSRRPLHHSNFINSSGKRVIITRVMWDVSPANTTLKVGDLQANQQNIRAHHIQTKSGVFQRAVQHSTRRPLSFFVHDECLLCFFLVCACTTTTTTITTTEEMGATFSAQTVLFSDHSPHLLLYCTRAITARQRRGLRSAVLTLY